MSQVVPGLLGIYGPGTLVVVSGRTTIGTSQVVQTYWQDFLGLPKLSHSCY